MFEKGQRVKVSVLDPGGNITSYRTGEIAFMRFKSPGFKEVDAYSVILDDQLNRVSYEGSIFPVERVFAE